MHASVEPMNRLTEKADWSPDYITDDMSRYLTDLEQFNQKNRNVRELWDCIIFPLLREKGLNTAIEIGSAPGYNLIELAKGIGVTPFGIEYTQEGALVNRALFAKFGYDPGNVRCDDFFSAEVDSLRNQFDLTLSFGFIEHFDNPGQVVERQIDLCKPGGYAIIVIPNIRGIYSLWSKLFDPRVLATHNLALMKPGVFFATCAAVPNFEIVFKGYSGVFEYGLLTHNETFLGRLGVSVMRRLGPALEWLDRSLMRRIGLGSPPYLLVVGRKTA